MPQENSQEGLTIQENGIDLSDWLVRADFDLGDETVGTSHGEGARERERSSVS